MGRIRIQDEHNHWIPNDTAILVIHGIGHQKPIETLDQFARTLIERFDAGIDAFEISHELARKPRSKSGYWYDNFIRIKRKGSEHHLDIYEYYWANQTQDQAEFSDITKWVRTVAKGADKFYKQNFELLKKEKRSFFKKNGKPKLFRYRLFLKISVWIIPAMQKLWKIVLILFSNVFLVWGRWLEPYIEGMERRIQNNLENIIGDIVVYNSLDAKSKFYEVRKAILDGAVKALRYLVEPEDEETDDLPYGRVLVAGHSLGSQISFDAINRLNQQVCMGDVKGYDANGNRKKDGQNGVDHQPTKINEVLTGLITFGSPLDKIAFFLWEHAEEDAYLRAQILKNFHSFKQYTNHKENGEQTSIKTVSALQKGPAITSPFTGLFDDIKWYNFHDRRDYVSGHLDFYHKVKNIDSDYESTILNFTHSRYWEDVAMFETIISDFIMPKKPPRYEAEKRKKEVNEVELESA